MTDVSTANDVEQRARAYHRLGRRLWLVGLILDVVLMLGFWLSGLSAGLAAWAGGVGPPALQVLVFAAVAGFGYTLLTAPLLIVRGFVLPRRFGLLRQPFGGWLADTAKAGVLGGLFGLAALEFAYWTFAAAPIWWWAICGGAAALVSLLLGFVAPVLIAPLFFRFQPLRRADIVQRIEGLLTRGHMQARGVYEFDLSRKLAAANAAVFGFGPTRRIILADSLLDRYTPAEIEAVVAHELGHHAHKDMWLGTAAGAAATVVALLIVALLFSPRLLGAGAPLPALASMPLWLLVFDLVTTALNPAALAISRWSERRADAYARATASEPAALASGLARIGRESLADPAPPRWEVLLRYSHPPMGERTGGAES